MPLPLPATLELGGPRAALDPQQKKDFLARALAQWGGPFNRVLVIGPDITRFHSGAGELTAMLYEMLRQSGGELVVLPALGTHAPMTDQEIATMYRGVPAECFRVHDWRGGLVKLGEIPSEYIADLTNGRLDYSIAVEVNRLIVEGGFDLILSIGQVVPHEVVGMANHNKNIFVGAGGGQMLHRSHFLGAVCGMEQIMGRIYTPVRRVFDYAEALTLAEAPIRYVLTVIGRDEENQLQTCGLFAGEGRIPFVKAARLSQQVNLTLLPEPIRKAVVYLDPSEFRSTWLGNKAVYRLRMAMADDGELLVLAPGLKEFGEDKEIDRLIRKYGYRGTPHTLAMVEQNPELRENLSAAAHLIHGSSEGRFEITYAPGHLDREAIEGVNFRYTELEPMLRRYNPERLRDGWNEVEGEQIYYVSNPALGLWALERDFPQAGGTQ